MNCTKSTLFIISVFLLAACSKSPDNNSSKNTPVVLRDCHTRGQVDDALGVPHAMELNGPSQLWAVGEGPQVNKIRYAVIRRSDDGGTTWKPVDLSVGYAGQGAINNAIVFGSANEVYVAQTFVKGEKTGAAVHFSVDAGQNWSDVPFPLQDKASEQMTTAVKGPDGTLYFAGTSSLDGRITSFVVALADQKLVLVDKIDNAQIKKVAFDNSGKLYEVGTLEASGTSAQGSTWLVRRQDSKDQWTSFLKDTQGEASSILIKKDGTVFVAGQILDQTGKKWTVEQSLDSGKTFKIVDSFFASHFTSSNPKTLIDYKGNPIVIGTAQDQGGRSHWVLRTNGVTKWGGLASFRQSNDSKYTAEAVGGVTSDAGDIFVIGQSVDNQAQSHWVVEKLSPCSKKPH